jgi:hypothetical protein
VGPHLVPIEESIHLIVDSTGLSTVGEGEWAAVKYGGRGKRGWKKLHLGVDRSGLIVAEVLTGGNADDAKTGVNLIDDVEGDIESFTADAAYDTTAIYDSALAHGAKVVIPPVKTATRSHRRRSRSNARDRTVMRVKEIGYRQWKKESGYHRQARVENTLFSVQDDHWSRTSRSSSEGTGSRGADGLQHPKSDDCPRQARILRDRRLMKIMGVGEPRPCSDSRTNAPERALRRRRCLPCNLRRRLARNLPGAGARAAARGPAAGGLGHGSASVPLRPFPARWTQFAAPGALTRMSPRPGLFAARP